MNIINTIVGKEFGNYIIIKTVSVFQKGFALGYNKNACGCMFMTCIVDVDVMTSEHVLTQRHMFKNFFKADADLMKRAAMEAEYVADNVSSGTGMIEALKLLEFLDPDQTAPEAGSKT